MAPPTILAYHTGARGGFSTGFIILPVYPLRGAGCRLRRRETDWSFSALPCLDSLHVVGTAPCRFHARRRRTIGPFEELVGTRQAAISAFSRIGCICTPGLSDRLPVSRKT